MSHLNESHKDQVSRVELMATDRHGTWDLSDKDCAALEAVLDDRQSLLDALKELHRVVGASLQGYGMLEGPMSLAGSAIKKSES